MKKPDKKLKTDGGTLSFFEDNHEYRWKKARQPEVRVPSVTGILRDCGLIDFSNVPEDVLERALERGTRVHQYTELIDLERPVPPDADVNLIGYVHGWQQFKRDYHVEVRDIEQLVIHPVLLYAGQLDRTIVVHKPQRKDLSVPGPWVCDIKSGQGEAWHGYQTAGYASAYSYQISNGNGTPAALPRCSVHVRDNGTYKVEVHNNPMDIVVFNAAATVYRAKHAS